MALVSYGLSIYPSDVDDCRWYYGVSGWQLGIPLL